MRHRGWGDVNWKAPAGKARQRDPPPRENGGEVGEKWHLKDTASRLKRSGSCEVRAREHPPLSASSHRGTGASHRLLLPVSSSVYLRTPRRHRAKRCQRRISDLETTSRESPQRAVTSMRDTRRGSEESGRGPNLIPSKHQKQTARSVGETCSATRSPREASALAQSRRPAPAGRPLHPEQEKQDDVCTGTRNTNGRCWSREERRIVRDRTATRLRPR